MQKFSSTIILVLILVGAAVSRIIGIDHGLPFPLRSNEENLIAGVLKMMELRTLIPALHYEEMKILIYPPFLAYTALLTAGPFIGGLFIASGMPSMIEFSPAVFDNLGTVFLLSRLTVAAFSVGTVFVVYRIGREIFKSQRAGLIAAALMAVDFLSAFSGHFARHWSITTFTIWLCALLAFAMIQQPRRFQYVALACVAGFGFGISYIGGAGILFGIAAHLKRCGIRRALDHHQTIMCAVFIAFVAIVILLHPFAAYRLTFGVMGITHDPKSILGFFVDVREYFRAFWHANPVLVLLYAGGIVISLFRKDTRVFLAGTAALIGGILFLHLTLRFEGRYGIILMPIMALMGGYGLHSVLIWSQAMAARRIIAILTIAIAFALPTATVLQANFMLSRDDTRVQALEWVHKNIPTDSRIAWDIHHVKLAASGEALEQQNKLDPNSMRAVDRFLLRRFLQSGELPTDVEKPRYDVLYMDQMTGDVADWVNSTSFTDYLDEHSFDFYISQARSPLYVTPLLAHFRKNGVLIKRFHGSTGQFEPPYLHSTVFLDYPTYHFFQMDRFGPVVEVYKLNHN